jgi:hypothetical protein
VKTLEREFENACKRFEWNLEFILNKLNFWNKFWTNCEKILK